MSAATLACFFRRLNEFLLARPWEQAEILWHGGEPLLMGAAFFDRARRYQETYCRETADRICHSMQSNLTLLTRNLLQSLGKLGVVSIGTSYEPFGNLRGLGKVRDAAAYKRRFLEAVDLLEAEQVAWGLIYVVTRHSLARPADLFTCLTNLAPPGGLRFNPLLPYGADLGHLRLTPEEFAHFLGAILREWWPRRGQARFVEPLAPWAQHLLPGQEPYLLCSEGGGCADTHLCVLPDGRASQCARAADWGLLDYGSILARSFADMFADPQREVVRRRQTVLPATECRGCRFWDRCHGGCPLEGWFAAGSFLAKGEWCRARTLFHETYLDPLLARPPAQGTPEES
jgi:uncharacterized protein